MTDAKMGDECKERVVRSSSFLKKYNAVVITPIKQVYFTIKITIYFIHYNIHMYMHTILHYQIIEVKQ